MTTINTGERLKELRERMNMTQHMTALKCGTHQEYISRLERNKLNLTRSMADRLARVYNVPRNYFWERATATESESLSRTRFLLDTYEDTVSPEGAAAIEAFCQFVLMGSSNKNSFTGVPIPSESTHGWNWGLRHLVHYLEEYGRIPWTRILINRWHLLPTGEPKTEQYVTGYTPHATNILDLAHRTGGIYTTETFESEVTTHLEKQIYTEVLGPEIMIIAALQEEHQEVFILLSGDSFSASDYSRLQGITESYMELYN